MNKTPTRGLWTGLLAIGGAVLTGIVVGMVAANVWPILLINLGVWSATGAELAFLALYV